MSEKRNENNILNSSFSLSLRTSRSECKERDIKICDLNDMFLNNFRIMRNRRKCYVFKYSDVEKAN